MKSILPILFLMLLYACQDSRSASRVSETGRDTTIHPNNAFTPLFLDSIKLEVFLSQYNVHDSNAKRMREFYSGRNYEFAWFFPEGIAPHASSFLDLMNDYIGYSGDSVIYNPSLDTMVERFEQQKPDIRNDSNLLHTELLLTRQFFRYANRAFQGRNQLNARELEWYIPRKKVDLVNLLDSIVNNTSGNFDQYLPLNRQYVLLKDYLLRYYSMEKNGGWPILPNNKIYQPGDEAEAIPLIKQYFFLTGDLAYPDSSTKFSPELKDAVKLFQQRHGLKADGIINKSTLQEMRISLKERTRQILINMERLRWAPKTPESDYLLVNIPEYRLHVYEKGKYGFSMDIVVGTAAHNTVIFTGTLKYIVFSPYWNVPPGILKNEILPAIQKDPAYLKRNNMEWHGNTVRQKPGANNSLGKVKFLFPNDYNIYLHDTPAKSLFSQTTRAFSHGCIRLSQPFRLAEFLLRNRSDWDSLKINQAMNLGKEQFVTLKEAVPVYIGYFTAWVDREGRLNFRKDIYGHDRKLAERLFENS